LLNKCSTTWVKPQSKKTFFFFLQCWGLNLWPCIW
jgi:hypothetical protein